uniref:Uncharacterized protein n=1 Tax=Podoviridae sp. ct8Lf7 TaxID=2827723 RepID=A0A8S5S0N6_9CAUD|nr:MAG TPA: hypothetical protein [Podoviridae sp. ct8Lf7]
MLFLKIMKMYYMFPTVLVLYQLVYFHPRLFPEQLCQNS